MALPPPVKINASFISLQWSSENNLLPGLFAASLTWTQLQRFPVPKAGSAVFFCCCSPEAWSSWNENFRLLTCSEFYDTEVAAIKSKWECVDVLKLNQKVSYSQAVIYRDKGNCWQPEGQRDNVLINKDHFWMSASETSKLTSLSKWLRSLS